MRHKLLLACGLIILLVFIYYFYQASACKRLSCVSFQNLEEFRLQDIYQEDKNTYRALYKKADSLLRVEARTHIGDNDAQQYINAQTTRMKGLFSDAPAPYPGVISDQISCDKKIRPVFKETTNNSKVDIAYFTGYLNQNLVFGSCTESEAVYKGILSFFYCPTHKQVFQLELIAPAANFDRSGFKEMLDSMGCK